MLMTSAPRTRARFILRFFERFLYRVVQIDSRLLTSYVKKKGVVVGEGTIFVGKQLIDLTRPELIEIGKNCIITNGVSILTHGQDFCVIENKYGELLGSSGKVVIEDNVFVGINTIILKNVRVGKNSIIGAGSVLTHDIPPNSVAAGNPCKVIITIEQYREKRKQQYVQEAQAYALELYHKKGQIPTKRDFLEEFKLYYNPNDTLGLGEKQLLAHSSDIIESNPLFESFESFLMSAGIPASEINKTKSK